MDSMRGHEGIQMLLTAEQEAQQIVTAARNLRTTRLRQAKEEAEKDAGHYRSNMESEYQKRVGETSGNSGFTAERLAEETDVKIRNLKKSASKVQSDIVDMLIKYTTAAKY
ncbi:PREDICTED: V-type proton ATPase subunit G3 [Populus euphratica]|uniref:V-type proton ATPase subunit G n=1 Tax=Populus euphratica TaxID=75702 RepID=A0AAJ6X3F8_POPEU|nr:PREDICTED: V-type proton ATPase subunit G3 [Populus euphratica]XP_011003990.1 PREDICTED: V-type proton ATPase subunit G3 [Populus euphratica]XP_011003991.1 PREDICTED: V-type proton ATPase subunit G3 [Populus euphratica]